MFRAAGSGELKSGLIAGPHPLVHARTTPLNTGTARDITQV